MTRKFKINIQLGLGAVFLSLAACSQDGAFDLQLKKTSVACFGGNCGGCARVEGYIGVAMNTQEPENLKKLSNYFDANGNINNIVPETVYGGYIPLWENLSVGNFVVKASNGNEYPRDGTSVRNYFGIRTITSLRSPKEDHPLADFLRGHIENKDIKLMFLMDGPSEVKYFDQTGTRTRVARIEEPSVDGSLKLMCMEPTFRFDREVGLNLEFDGAFTGGDINSPGKITIYPLMTEATNPLIPTLCGATVWRDDNPLKPTSGDILETSEILPMGVFAMPMELFQTSLESRAKFSEMQDCPVDEFSNQN